MYGKSFSKYITLLTNMKKIALLTFHFHKKNMGIAKC